MANQENFLVLTQLLLVRKVWHDLGASTCTTVIACSTGALLNTYFVALAIDKIFEAEIVVVFIAFQYQITL